MYSAECVAFDQRHFRRSNTQAATMRLLPTFTLALVALAATGTHSSHATTPPSPKDVAKRMVGQILSRGNWFFPADEYGAALLFQAMFEAEEAFQLGHSGLLSARLDAIIAQPGTSAYILLHNNSFRFDSAIGDRKGLFPLAYLYRARFFGRNPGLAPPGYNRTRDIWIAEEGARRFVLAFPHRLKDGTIARLVGGPYWPPTTSPSYLWGDDQFMGLTLVCGLAAELQTSEWVAAVGWAAKQQSQFRAHMADSADNLYAHGVRLHSGAYEHSCCKWGRVNGWGMMANTETLQAMDTLQSAGVNVTGRADVLRIFAAHAEGMAR